MNAPKKVTWLIAVIVGVVGIIGHFITIPVVSSISYWLLFGGFVLLTVATLVKGL
jgi:hypothetical protein